MRAWLDRTDSLYSGTTFLKKCHSCQIIRAWNENQKIAKLTQNLDTQSWSAQWIGIQRRPHFLSWLRCVLVDEEKRDNGETIAIRNRVGEKLRHKTGWKFIKIIRLICKLTTNLHQIITTAPISCLSVLTACSTIKKNWIICSKTHAGWQIGE